MAISLSVKQLFTRREADSKIFFKNLNNPIFVSIVQKKQMSILYEAQYEQALMKSPENY